MGKGSRDTRRRPSQRPVSAGVISPRSRPSRGSRVRLVKQDRLLTRKQLGGLRDLVITAATEERYNMALMRFFAFEESQGEYFSRDVYTLDAGVADYICALWENGDPRHWGEDTVSSMCKKVPSLKGCFPSAWQLLTAWQRHELPIRATPLSTPVLLAMCGLAIEWGDVSLMLTLAVSFHCLLRTAESFSIRIADMQLTQADTAVLSLPLTKSGQRFNVKESVTITDRYLVAALSRFTRSKEPGDLLYQGGARSFRSSFGALVRALDLPRHARYMPYSIRRGAATADFRMHGLLSRTTVRGRWKHERTCRIYINEALLELGEIQFSQKSQSLIDFYSAKARLWLADHC